MAKVSQLSRIKAVRVKFGLTHALLAKAMGVCESDIRAWEKDASKATDAQLRDLAIVLDVAVSELLGVKSDDEESLDMKFAPTVRGGLDYGTLKMTVSGQVFEYPIDRKAYELISAQLEGRNPQENFKPDCWLATWSLNDKLIYVNFAHLSEIELIGDDAEEMPDYEHPEVYRLLGMWDLFRDFGEKVGPVLLAHCQKHVDRYGAENAIQEATHARVVFENGRTTWHHLLEIGDTVGYHVLELEADMGIPPHSFIQVASEGYYRGRYVNLSHVALIEIPASRYYEASNSEEH